MALILTFLGKAALVAPHKDRGSQAIGKQGKRVLPGQETGPAFSLVEPPCSLTLRNWL